MRALLLTVVLIGRARRVTLVITAETASGMTQWRQPLRLRRR